MILNLYAVAVSVREGGGIKSFPMHVAAQSRNEAKSKCYQWLLDNTESVNDVKISVALIPQHIVKWTARQYNE